MLQQKYVDDYISLYRDGKIKLNKERVLLIEYLERDILSRNDLYFNDEMIEDCINFGEKWYFPLNAYQKFLIAFVFLFVKKTKRVFYRKHLWMLGRGGGKNGLITVICNFLISDLHGIREYNISVIANSEKQAKTSVGEAEKTIKLNSTLRKYFKATATKIVSKLTDSEFTYLTSNGDTKDGLRDGAVVFDEIHYFETNKDVRVHISGLGKKPNPREFYIGTDGYIRDGFLDKLKERAMNVLNGNARSNALFPFICKLDDEKEVENPELWEKANPMLSRPLSEYAQGLFDTVYEEYEDLEEDPSNREEFMTKRMNCPVTDLQRSVATWDEIEAATKLEMPELNGHECIGCLDFASIRDFAACGLLFRPNGKYVFKTHSFVRKDFADIFYAYSKKRNDKDTKKVLAPIREWEEKGLLTVIDEPTINVEHIVNYFVEARKNYAIKKIVIDNFRADLVRTALEKEGFEIEVIRNPKAADALLAPRIETAFANNQIIFGDNPLMRWYTNNVLVVIKKDGNKEYSKKEPIRRKTDGFDCFVTGMWRADEISESSIDNSLDFLHSIKF